MFSKVTVTIQLAASTRVVVNRGADNFCADRHRCSLGPRLFADVLVAIQSAGMTVAVTWALDAWEVSPGLGVVRLQRGPVSRGEYRRAS